MSDNLTAPQWLVVSAPADLEDDLVETLRELPDLRSGFTLIPAEGIGAGLALGTAMEQVRGRARRCLFVVPVDGHDVAGLVARLAREFPRPDIQWWLLPVAAAGRFA